MVPDFFRIRKKFNIEIGGPRGGRVKRERQIEIEYRGLANEKKEGKLKITDVV